MTRCHSIQNPSIEGKMLLMQDNEACLARGGEVYECQQKRKAAIMGWKYAWASSWNVTRRLLRAEVTGLYRMMDGSVMLIAKKGLFLRTQRSKVFKKCLTMPRGSKPLSLCVMPNGHVFFGEYFQNMKKDAVNVYGSFDYGRTWKIVYTFLEGNINHIHGLFHDPYAGRMWFLTGDRDNECIIGYTEDEFKTVKEVFRGGQEYRSCLLFFYRDFIVFATDSQYMQNEIRCFDRETLEITSLVKIQGSAIKGGQKGNVAFLSTTVEPSDVNKDTYAHVWVTRDGLHWKDVYAAKKDCWPAIFQFGTFEFPQYLSPITDKLYCSGRALKGCDGKTICIDISDV